MKRGVAGIIENYDGNFLLHMRDKKAPTMKNQWCLVGGSLEDNEDIEQALIREIKEETALEAHNLSFVQTFIFNNKNITIYHCYVDTRKQKMLIGEGEKLHFFKPTELSMLIEKLPYKNQYLDLMLFFLKNR
ncbi:MAG: NUDIX hydrolase [Candidatus Moranbacteria bacterium]|jgi:8-oxo-dGTP diphosphatase|nr:NUDIX hydrolase [Candidatus Moranbacteria bacterium]